MTQTIDLQRCRRAFRCNNRSELTGQTLTDWCREQDVQLPLDQPGKPDLNAYIERFSRTYREETLSAFLFDSLDAVRYITVEWIGRYG
ncbi:MAG: integrase core domain-containing protein [Burkholderiales bacterium]